jgi:hypothetical protein
MIKLNENVDYDIIIDQSLNRTLIKYQCGVTSTLSQKNNHFIVSQFFQRFHFVV